jgi:hypothetical protein
LGFTEDEIVHHDDVVLARVVRARLDAAALDSHTGNPRVVEDHPEKRQAGITRRRRHEAAV